jgi:hypothetical protein
MVEFILPPAQVTPLPGRLLRNQRVQVEQRLSFFEIARIKPFREPAVDRARLIALPLVAPEPRHAHCGAQLRVLYLAVVTGEVRARLTGRIFRLDQIALMGQINPFSLPHDLELSIKDARRKWGGP